MIVRTVAFVPDRITPAWAGNSKAEASEQARIQDHPRMGGE